MDTQVSGHALTLILIYDRVAMKIFEGFGEALWSLLLVGKSVSIVTYTRLEPVSIVH